MRARINRVYVKVGKLKEPCTKCSVIAVHITCFAFQPPLFTTLVSHAGEREGAVRAQ